MIEKNEEPKAFKDVLGLLWYVLEKPGVNRAKRDIWHMDCYVTIGDTGGLVNEQGDKVEYSDLTVGKWVSAPSLRTKALVTNDEDMMAALIKGHRVHVTDTYGKSRIYFLKDGNLQIEGDYIRRAFSLPAVSLSKVEPWPFFYL